MFIKDQCKYYAPCGLCTYYDKPCDKVCKRQERQIKRKTSFLDDDVITVEPKLTMGYGIGW